jgi:hypothetical protein
LAREVEANAPRRNWRPTPWISAGAAVAAIAASLLLVIWLDRHGVSHQPPQQAVIPHPSAAAPIAPASPAVPLVRDPSVLERVIAMKSLRGEDNDAQRLARATQPAPFDDSVEPLFAQLQAPRVPDRMLAAAALARRNDPAVTRRLIAMLPEPGTRREVLAALARSREPTAQAFVQSVQSSNPTIASLIRSVHAGS